MALWAQEQGSKNTGLGAAAHGIGYVSQAAQHKPKSFHGLCAGPCVAYLLG